MQTFSSKIRYSELDKDRLLSVPALIDYFQDVSNFESEEKGVGLDWLLTNHTVWMLTGWQITVLRRPNLGEEIDAITWACGFRHFIGQRCFELRYRDGELLAYAYSEWAYIDTQTEKPATIPEKEYEAYGYKEPLDIEIKKTRVEVPKDLSEREEFTVTRANIDTNNHVNNGQYIAIAMNYLPEGFKPAKINAVYKGQSRLGDALTPKINEEKNRVFVGLWDQTGFMRFACEFIDTETNAV